MRLFCLLMVAGIGVVACSDRTTFISPGGPVCATSVSVSPASATIHAGDTLRVAFSAPAPPCGPAATGTQWSSSNTAIATVDSTGLVRARDTGAASIIGAMIADPTVKGAMSLQVTP